MNLVEGIEQTPLGMATAAATARIGNPVTGLGAQGQRTYRGGGEKDDIGRKEKGGKMQGWIKRKKHNGGWPENKRDARGKSHVKSGVIKGRKTCKGRE